MQLYQPTITGSLLVSGSIVATGGITVSGSIDSASYAATASFVTLSQTASFVANAQSASNAVTAQTASYANALTVAGTLTAQTLVVQTITSSVDFVTGSTRFGSLSSNTHVFSGSVTMNPNGLFVTSSGLVGIGTTNPANFLHINGLNPNLIIQNTTSSVGSEAVLTFRSTFGDGNIVYLGYIRAIQQSTTQNTGDIAIHAYSTGSANEVIRIKGASGYIGIGTSNPQSILDIRSSNVPRIQMVKTGIISWYLGDTQQDGTNTFSIGTDSGTNYRALNILNTGNVGIGITNPADIFHVQKSSTGNFDTYLDNPNTTAGNGVRLVFRTTDSGGSTVLNAGGIRTVFNSRGSSTCDNDIIIGNRGGDWIYVKNSGYIGIACTDPTLVNITGTTAPLLQIRNSSDSSGQIRIGGSSSTGVGLVLDYSNSGYTTSTIRALYATTSDSCALNIDSGYIAFRTGTSLTERMRINGAGLITAPYIMGKYFDMTSGAGTGTAITDTGIYVSSGDWGGFGRSTIYLVTFSANPNNGGSGEYSAVHTGYITVYTGWSGSNVTTYIAYTQVAVGNNIGTLTLSPTFWNGSTESSAVTRASISGYQIRIKISGYNSSFTGANQALYITKIITSG